MEEFKENENIFFHDIVASLVIYSYIINDHKLSCIKNYYDDFTIIIFFVIIFLSSFYHLSGDWAQLGGSHLGYVLQSDSDLSWSYLEGFLTQVFSACCCFLSAETSVGHVNQILTCEISVCHGIYYSMRPEF